MSSEISILDAVSHPDFLLARVDSRGKLATIIHRTHEVGHPTGRHGVLQADANEVLSALDSIGKRGAYTVGSER